MKGGFDLYGNYYPNEIDAMNAEMSQCNEIDNRLNRQKIQQTEQQQARNIYYLTERIEELEKRIERLESKEFEYSPDNETE